MSAFVLVIILYIGRSGQVDHVDMPSQEVCERERDSLEAEIKKRRYVGDVVFIYCMRRG